MKGETAEQVAERMRAIAASMSDKGDAAEIVGYANWLAGRRRSSLSDDPPTLESRSAVSAEVLGDEP